ncbi:MAG: 2-isopropylmalate synthase [Clostridia bacterium]
MNPSYKKYIPFKPLALTQRKWPAARVDRAPTWCSVDLRDGNQALVEPMNLEEKLAFFEGLVSMGFKEIEIGFPSASQVEFDFARALIEQNMIPDDVTVQVLTQAREHLIRRTFDAIDGAKHVILHLYNNTSPFFRQVVYKTDVPGIIAMATEGAKTILRLARARPDAGASVRYEYSPEGFSATEPDNAVRVCLAMLDAFEATPARPLILNLPATVEVASPNNYADQVEYFINHIGRNRDYILSVHPHNDRGTGVASAEMAMLAGAQRVEGTLFGNGERTGNCDLVTLALNLYTQGVDPGLDFTHLNRIKALYQRCTKMRIHERQPYAGELVFTAFSGSHQDAIKKGFDYMRKHDMQMWQMPYLPIDPDDLGRAYEPIIRINSQSGKGGAVYLLQSHFGYNLPKEMHADFGGVVKAAAERMGAELSADQLLRIFIDEYEGVQSPYKLLSHDITERGSQAHSLVSFTGVIAYRNREYPLSGAGNGPIDAFFSAMQEAHIDGFTFAGYHEHAIGQGSNAKAVAYIELKYREKSVFGVGIESNVSIASIKGVLSAVNRALQAEEGLSNDT